MHEALAWTEEYSKKEGDWPDSYDVEMERFRETKLERPAHACSF